MSTNVITFKLIENGHHCKLEGQVSREMNTKIASLRACDPANDYSPTEAFTENKMAAAVK